MQTRIVQGTGVMRWGSAVSDSASLTEAIGRASEIVLEQLDGRSADLVMTFVSYQHASSFYSVNELLRQYFEIKNDEEKSQRKFDEITIQHQKLVQAGIIVI